MKSIEPNDMYFSLTAKELNSIFVKFCSNGIVDDISYILDEPQLKGRLNPIYLEMGFSIACSNNQANVVKLFKEKLKNIDVSNTEAFLCALETKDQKLMEMVLNDNQNPTSIVKFINKQLNFGKFNTLKNILSSDLIKQQNENTSNELIKVGNEYLNIEAIFITACERGDLELVKTLLNDKTLIKNVNIDCQNGAGLIKACEYGADEVIEFLLTSPDLKEHANIHAQDDLALLYASYRCDLPLVQYLLTSPDLKEHANIHAQDDSALLYAVKGDSLELVKYLTTSPELEDHANIHTQEDYALLLAFKNDNANIVKFFLEDPSLNSHIDIYKHLEELSISHFASLEMKKLRGDDEDFDPSFVDKDYNCNVLKYLVCDYGLYLHDNDSDTIIKNMIFGMEDLEKEFKYRKIAEELYSALAKKDATQVKPKSKKI